MALAGQNQVRHIYVGKTALAANSVAAHEAGALGAISVINADGEAATVASGNKFLLLSKEQKGTVTSDVINPNNIKFAKSVSYKAAVPGTGTISDIVVNNNTLYTIEVAISQFGSYSGENEYIKKAFYQAPGSASVEGIVDGLIQSLARNFSREEPKVSGTKKLKLASGAFLDVADNAYFTFKKVQTGGTAEITTLTTTEPADEIGTIGVTLDGEFVVTFDFIATSTEVQIHAGLAAAINASDAPYTAVAGATTTVITSDNHGDEVNAAIIATAANYNLNAIPTIATTTAGAEGTPAFALVIAEKASWAEGQFDADKRTRQNIVFNVNAAFTTLPTIVNVASTPGSGTGMQVAELEFYLKGERGDFMREAGYPHSMPGVMEADKSETYDLIELGYFEEGRDEAKKSNKGITLAFPVSARTASNALIAELNVAIPGAIVIATLS